MSLTLDEIKSKAPNGATHYDEQDYWKNENDEWYIWLVFPRRWFRIYSYQKFHDSIPIKPLN